MFDRGSGFVALGLSSTLIASSLRWNGPANANLVGLATFIIIGSGLVFVSEVCAAHSNGRTKRSARRTCCSRK